MSEERWAFHYTIADDQKPRQSRSFATKEEALAVACAYETRGHAVTLLEGPGGKMNGAAVAEWCKNNFRG